MLSRLKQFFSSLFQENTQKNLTFFITVLIIPLAGGVWAIYQQFSQEPSKPLSTNSTSISENGIKAGGNLSIGDQAIVNTGSGSVNIGISLEQYEAGLKRREQEIRADVEQANKDDKAKIAILEKQLTDIKAVSSSPANIEKALKDTNTKYTYAYKALEMMKTEVLPDTFEVAKHALTVGNTSYAENLFKQTLSRAKNDAAEAAYQLAQLAFVRFDYLAARQYSEKAAELAPYNPKYLILAGNIYFVMGDLLNADIYVSTALRIQEKSLSDYHPDVINSLFLSAQIASNTGKYDKEEEYFKRLLANKENMLGIEHPDVSYYINGLAMAYYNQGKLFLAESIELRIIDVLEKKYGRDYLGLASILNNLGYFFQNDQNLVEKAEEMYLRALDIYSKAQQVKISSVSNVYYNLAKLYRDKGLFNKAEHRYMQILALQERYLEKNNPDKAETLLRLATLFLNKKEYKAAESYSDQALAIQEQIYGKDSSIVANTINNKGGLFYEQGKYEDAEINFKLAISILEKTIGTDNPKFIGILYNLLETYKKQGKNKASNRLTLKIKEFEKSKRKST